MTDTVFSSNEPRAVVTSFLKAWSTDGRIKAFAQFLSPDCMWKNTHFPDMAGKAGAIRLLSAMVDAYGGDRCDVELVGVAESGNTVLTERIDSVHKLDGTVEPRKVMGTFIVEAGKINYFADYFDPAPYLDKRDAVIVASKPGVAA